MLSRKVEFRMYPDAAEEATFLDMLGLHCRLANTLLEEHKRRYEEKEPSYTFKLMCRDLTQWRGNCMSLAALNAQSMQVTAKRVALAFNRFFERVKKGETPGYPRFKSPKRYKGWGYKSHGDGWKLVQKHSVFKSGKKGPVGIEYGAVVLSGVGTISLRGRGRFDGTPKTAEVIRKHGKWYLSVTFAVEEQAAQRQSGQQSMAFDWGLATLLTSVVGDWEHGDTQEIPNPRWLRKKLGLLKELQRAVSVEETKAKTQSGKDSQFPVSVKLARLYARVRKVHGQVARQRHDFYHKLTAVLVKQFGVIATEQLNVKNMSKRPKAKPLEDGSFAPNGAAAKAGLNRSILDAAAGLLMRNLRYKAAEAGTKLFEHPTRKIKPTQRCCCCGQLNTMALEDRIYNCACGNKMPRDENSARVLLRYTFEGAWWENEQQRMGTVRESGQTVLT